MEYKVWVQVEEIDDEEGHFENIGDPDEFGCADTLEEAQKIAEGIFSQEQELDFWRKTAAELFGLASESDIEEHLSEKQQQRCAEALHGVVTKGLEDEPTPRPLPQTMPSSEDAYRERAREFFRGELDENDWDIDDEPQVSESNEGAYVVIWRWFPAEHEEES